MAKNSFRSLSIVPLLLSLNAGFVDTAGFLALQGLFTAHVTGNFVTLGAALVTGTSGILAKVLALPVFCVVVVATRIAGRSLGDRNLPTLEALLGFKLILLMAAAACAIAFRPFADGDAAPAIATGMLLVSAMAIQNTVHRVHLAAAPPTTLMTGTTTQIMMDFADIITHAPPAPGPEPRARVATMSKSVACFALGCAGAALAFAQFGSLSLVVPPILACCTIVAHIALARREA